MREIKYSSQFKRDVKQAKKRNKDIGKLYKVLELIINDCSLPESLKDHALKGDFKPRRELHIAPDWLLVYIKNESVIIFDRTGSHSDLF